MSQPEALPIEPINDNQLNFCSATQANLARHRPQGVTIFSIFKKYIVAELRHATL
jgi:hypothetical protein